jgi:hypothetical protein
MSFANDAFSSREHQASATSKTGPGDPTSLLEQR